MKRREFIQQTVLVASATAALDIIAEAKVNWPIGCFNRPWVNEKKGWTYDTCLLYTSDAADE